LLHYQPGALAENYIMDPEDLEAIVASFRSLHVDEDDEALRQRMEQSIQEYNRKARESDHRFVRECVEAVAAAGLETEQEKLNRMAHVFFAMEDWGTNIDFDAKPHLKPKQLGDYGWPPERLDQVLELPQLSRDSLKPALSKEFSAMLVQEMTNVVFGEHAESSVVPKELAAFFSCVSGVYDLDYNRLGLCEFEAPVKEGVSQEEMHETLESENTVPEDMKEEIPDVFERLDVLGGFHFGWNTGLWRGEPVRQWHSFYLFCRSKDHEEVNAGWGWRVVVQLESDDDEGIVAPVKIFDTIPDFLQWYGNWYDRLDRARFLKELAEGVEFD
ncbi:hypothetical protein KCU78_g6094, partial [Aureobasidium melanogenum]